MTEQIAPCQLWRGRHSKHIEGRLIVIFRAWSPVSWYVFSSLENLDPYYGVIDTATLTEWYERIA